MDRRFYTTKEAADILRVSDDFVVDAVNSGVIPALRPSPRIIRIPVIGFEQYLAGISPTRRRVTIRPMVDSPDLGAGEELPEQAGLPQRVPQALAVGR